MATFDNIFDPIDLEALTNYFYSDKLPQQLWHYTDANALINILQNGSLKFWFTQVDSLNDSSEGQILLSVYRSVCEEMLHSKKINKDFYEMIKDFNLKTSGLFGILFKERIEKNRKQWIGWNTKHLFAAFLQIKIALKCGGTIPIATDVPSVFPWSI